MDKTGVRPPCNGRRGLEIAFAQTPPRTGEEAGTGNSTESEQR